MPRQASSPVAINTLGKTQTQDFVLSHTCTSTHHLLPDCLPIPALVANAPLPPRTAQPSSLRCMECRRSTRDALMFCDADCEGLGTAFSSRQCPCGIPGVGQPALASVRNGLEFVLTLYCPQLWELHRSTHTPDALVRTRTRIRTKELLPSVSFQTLYRNRGLGVPRLG